MTARFCPECGADCDAADVECRECGFPLALKIIISRQKVSIPGNQFSQWNRISKLLRHNGIRVESKSASDIWSHQLWWALPTFGMLTFIASIFFGPAMVDKIWQPPAVREVVDLNAALQPQALDNSRPEGEADTSFLMEALKTDKEQIQLSQEQEYEESDFVNRIAASPARLRDMARQSLLRVDTDGLIRGGTLVGAGLYLTDSNVLLGAFRREKRTVTENGNLVQKTTYIVPKAGFPLTGQVESEQVFEAGKIGLTLMRAKLSPPQTLEMEFDQDLEIGEKVFIPIVIDGKYYTQSYTIRSGINNAAGVNVWTIQGEVNPEQSGSPVLNFEGKLAGVYLYDQGEHRIVSLRQIRERAPTIFKTVIN